MGVHVMNGVLRVMSRVHQQHRLKFHPDRPWLDEQIYGVVLDCEDGRDGLSLRKPSADWAWVCRAELITQEEGIRMYGQTLEGSF